MDSRDELRARWANLVARFQGTSLVKVRPALLRVERQVFVIHVLTLQRIALALVMLSAGLLFLIGPLVMPPPRVGPAPPNLDAPRGFIERQSYWLFPLAGVVCVGAAATVFFRRDELLIDGNQEIVRIQWGVAPFDQHAEFPLRDLRLLLYPSDGEHAGYTALGIALHDDRTPLRIAHTKWRTQLEPIFAALSPLFGARAIDTTLSTVSASFTSDSICRTPIRIEVRRGRSRKLTIHEHRAVLRDFASNAILTMLFAMALAAMIAIIHQFRPLPPTTLVIISVVAGLIGVAGILLWPRKIVLSRDAWLQLPRCTVEGRLDDRLHGRDITAIQLCVVEGEGEHIAPLHFKFSDYRATQVNLIAGCSPACRINLICDTHGDRAAASARQLAELLSVPILDHR